MSYMFSNFYNLSELSIFNTNNVSNIIYIFYYCLNLNKLEINKINIKIIKEAINISK